MARARSKEKRETLWEKINLSQLKTAILSLGDRIQEMNTETWRTNERRNGIDSIWNHLCTLLDLETSESNRRSLYNNWRRNRQQIKQLVGMESTDDGRNRDNIENESISADSQTHTPLQGVVSSPIPVRAKRSGLRSSNSNDNGIDDDENGESLIIFSFAEWKAAFSRTHQNMKPEWRAVFRKKLEESGSVCTVNF